MIHVAHLSDNVELFVQSVWSPLLYLNLRIRNFESYGLGTFLGALRVSFLIVLLEFLIGLQFIGFYFVIEATHEIIMINRLKVSNSISSQSLISLLSRGIALYCPQLWN